MYADFLEKFSFFLINLGAFTLFKSRFETVLKHREWVEDKVQRELADIKHSLNKEKGTLVSYNQSLENSLKELHQKQTEGALTSELSLYFPFFNRLASLIQKKKKTIEDMSLKLNSKLEELVDASKQKKIIKKIKEKERKDFLIKKIKQEQRFMDEIGINKYNRERSK